MISYPYSTTSYNLILYFISPQRRRNRKELRQIRLTLESIRNEIIKNPSVITWPAWGNIFTPWIHITHNYNLIGPGCVKSRPVSDYIFRVVSVLTTFRRLQYFVKFYFITKVIKSCQSNLLRRQASGSGIKGIIKCVKCHVLSSSFKTEISV